MTSRSYRHLLVFVDGIGLAPAGPNNPFSTVETPALSKLLGGPLVLGAERVEEGLVLSAIDACLGVDGLPQSATGQTTLLTGINAQREIGHHVTALPGPRLRTILEEHSVFRQLEARGRRVTFANAYTERYIEALEAGTKRPSATTCALCASSAPYRTFEDLRRGEAVTWDVVRDRFREHAEVDIDVVDPYEAGQHLAAIADENDFTLYETFLTDLAGHGRFDVAETLRRIDGLLHGVLDGRASDLTVLVASDHGNLEDTSTRAHTRNPIPLLAVGPRARAFSDVRALDEIVPRIVET